MTLPENVGRMDKYVRIGVGILLIVLAVTGTIGVWGYLGILPLATGFLNTCPAYTLFGISTRETEKKA
ncbi:MAG: DUF2892 domain-containing protein [Methylotetracoccus sp.]|jgi:hypothetical protein|nr:DUF2892 domain-containing protein [Methylotetracoccus sp.]